MDAELFYSSPNQLREMSWDDLLAGIQATESWTNRYARVLDFVYRVHLAFLLCNHQSLDDLIAFSDHLSQVIVPHRAEQLNRLKLPYAERWRLLRDLLEDRIEAGREKIPESVLTRKHVKEALGLVFIGVRSQRKIREYLGLEEANFSRILGPLEKWEIIQRVKVGKENQWMKGRRFDELPWTDNELYLTGSAQMASSPSSVSFPKITLRGSKSVA